MHQVLIITRPRIDNDDGTFIKPNILGYGQPLIAFGNDLLYCSKQIHSLCYQANEKHLNQDTLEIRTNLHKKAIEYCDSILRLLDLCIFEYAQNNKQKRKSFIYIAKLTKELKTSLQNIINRDKLIINP